MPFRGGIVALIFLALLSLFEGPAQAQPAAQPLAIKDGVAVSMEYTLTDESGKVIQSNKDKEPLVFTQGSGQIIPGLAKALVGMREGETKHVTVPPEEAYGPPNPAAVIEVPRNQVPPNASVGGVLMGRNQRGQPVQAVVKEIKETVVVLDLNHPLAGKTLIFDVKILSVSPPKAN